MPKRISACGRNIVRCIREFCERERDLKAPIIPFEKVCQRVAAMTGLSERTVINISNEPKVTASTSVSSPPKKRSRRKVKLDNFDKCAIRNKVHEMYTVRKEIPTISKLLVELKTDIQFHGGRTTLWKIIHELGFEFKKCRSRRKLLMERHDIVAWRIKYLTTMKKNRTEGRPVVFLDETYIHTNYTSNKCWQNEDEKGVYKSDSVGVRWIIVHAGGDMGFIPDALLIFKSHSKSGDYHDDMNRVNFIKWLKEKLIPNLPPNCLIVMDNASYHTVSINKAPTFSSTKSDMQAWITKKGLSYLPTMLKAELYEIIKEHKEAPIYEADQILEAHGHKVARLPPYHCELNAIEFMWSLVKRRVASRNVSQGTNILQLTQEAFESVTIEDWQKQCAHVRHTEDKMLQNAGILDIEMDRFVIELNENSDTESDSRTSYDDSVLDDSDLTSIISLDHSYSK